MLSLVVVVFAGAALIVSLTALVATLGAMREVVLLRERLTLSQTADTPPSFLGDRAPTVLLDAVRAATQGHGLDDDRVVLMLSGGCSGCRALMSELSDNPTRLHPKVRSRLVIIAEDSDGRKIRGVEELGLAYLGVDDGSRELFHAAEVHETPAGLVITEPSGIVTDVKLGASIEWVIDTLERRAERAVPKNERN